MGYTPKQCRTCGATFEPRHPRNAYCSRACRSKADTARHRRWKTRQAFIEEAHVLLAAYKAATGDDKAAIKAQWNELMKRAPPDSPLAKAVAR